MTAAQGGGPVNHFSGGPVAIRILALLSTQYCHWPCVGWPKRIYWTQ